MFNDYYLLKRVQEEEGAVSYASVMDSFTYMGEVVTTPAKRNFTGDKIIIDGHIAPIEDKTNPQEGDKVLFLKGSGEDVTVNGEQMKAVKLEDIIMKI